jgi:cytochrome c peroxidase
MHNRCSRALVVLAAWLSGSIAPTACGRPDPLAPEPGLEHERTSVAVTLADRIAACNADPRVQLNLVSNDVCVGADLFFRESFDGNGRTCATCHPAQNNFTIDPAFIATLPASDPLFVAEQNSALATLERPALLRQFGLILENVDGFDNLANKFTMRSVPHTFSLTTSVAPGIGDGSTVPPNERTGWSGDGAPGAGELRDFQTGAITQHYPKTLARAAGSDFRLATTAELDRIVAFMRTIGRTNELNLAQVTTTDTGAAAGRALFLGAGRCNACHLNAGANFIWQGTNFNFDTGVERVRIAALDVQGLPRDGGFGGTGLVAPNFDANGDGILDSFGNGTFNAPSLIEAADTGPFFHTNAFATIEDAVAFYNTPAFNNSPAAAFGQINLNANEVANVARFLRVLNAAFNAQIALARLGAADAIAAALQDGSLTVQLDLLRLAGEEVDDARAVLSAVGLNHSSAVRFHVARNHLNQAIHAKKADQRRHKIAQATAELTAGNAQLGTNITFTMGPGTLMF